MLPIRSEMTREVFFGSEVVLGWDRCGVHRFSNHTITSVARRVDHKYKRANILTDCAVFVKECRAIEVRGHRGSLPVSRCLRWWTRVGASGRIGVARRGGRWRRIRLRRLRVGGGGRANAGLRPGAGAGAP